MHTLTHVDIGPSNARHSVSSLAHNIGYGIGSDFCGAMHDFIDDDVIYEEIADEPIGSRRNGLYGGGDQDMDSYSVYDVVL